MTFDEIAAGVVQVAHGVSRGSGFHLGSDDIVVTNAHVIAAGIGPLRVTSEDGQVRRCTVISSSPQTSYDWTVLRLESPFDGERTVFEPGSRPARGAHLAIAGYPHGLDDLLVHDATMSGPFGTIGFHLDASVNGGNSGGPVVDLETGRAVGIVTLRRFVDGNELEAVAREAEQLRSYASEVTAHGNIAIMGIDFAGVMQMLGGAIGLIQRVAANNANSGIGIGYHIEHVVPYLPA